MKKENKDLYQMVTDKVVAALEKANGLVWRKTFKGYGLARNLATGHYYSGINFIILNFCTENELPYYLTFKQVKQLGGKICKGAKSEQVIYFNVSFKDKNDQKITQEEARQLKRDGEEIKVKKYIKYYNVFNIADIGGIEHDITVDHFKDDNSTIENCAKLIENIPDCPTIKHNNPNRAFYSISDDYINIPRIQLHKSSETYYSVLFHELIHSTGAASRLNRETLNKIVYWGDEVYSEEELVAELGASFLAAMTGIDQESLFENSVAYLQSWLSKLKDDKQLIFRASAAAQKAVNYLVSN